MSPETHARAAARDGFATYDELTGPDLDAARWIPARLPLAAGGEHIALDPNAGLAVGAGEVRVTIPRFSLAHSAKHLHKLYEAHTFIPERVLIGFGIWTMLPERDGRSVDGQGMNARWRRFRVRGVDV